LIFRMSGKIEDWDDNQQEAASGGGASDINPSDAWFQKLGHEWIPVLSVNLCKLPVKQSLQLNVDALQRPLITLLCESLELFLSSLMDRKEEFKQLSETVLAVAECPSVSSNILELTFNFWAALPAELASFKDSEDVETRQDPFLYLFSRLFTALLQGPLIFKSGGSAEDIDKFREFRHVVGDCLKDCVRVLGSTEPLFIIHSQLTANSPLVQREAALFALRTISSSTETRESEAMPLIVPKLAEILQELLLLPSERCFEYQSLKMISAVVLNVGCYAEWLRYHSEFMGSFLQILSLSLDYALSSNGQLEKTSSVIGSSLQSLKYMCESCAGLLGAQY
jgi:transportin-3